MADIISIEKTPKTPKNVFVTANRIYAKHINGEKDCLFSNFQVEKFQEKTMISMTFTLLPHQILIFPVEYKDKIVNTEIFDEMNMFLDDQSIR